MHSCRSWSSGAARPMSRGTENKSPVPKASVSFSVSRVEADTFRVQMRRGQDVGELPLTFWECGLRNAAEPSAWLVCAKGLFLCHLEHGILFFLHL